MRFAYIDSQGNEIAVSNVDALGLRIELGAIGPETPLYDARADRWGPARTHEVFHTLARLVKPGGELPAVLLPEFEGEEAPPRPDPEARRPTGSDLFFDLGQEVRSIAPGVEKPQTPPPPTAAETVSSPVELDLEFTLTDVAPAVPEDPAPAEAEPESPPLAVEGESTDAASIEDSEPAPIASGNELELEPPLGEMDFSGAQADPLSVLDLEPPLAESETGQASGGAPTTDEASPRVEETPAAPLRPVRRRGPVPRPRSRPSPPRRVRRRPSMGMVIGSWTVVVVVGYLGWQALRSAGGAPEADRVTTRPPVTIPDLPAEMVPLMRQLAEAALSETVEELSGLQAEVGLPAAPRDDWLAGVYMANASRFADVEQYWTAMGTWIRRVRETEGHVFHARYAAALAERGVDAGEAELLQARADSGFLATSPGRQDAYAQMDDLVLAALELHRFLLDNEAQIAYEPAMGGVSGDPVLEAVPSSTELGDRMWDMVDRITGALDALGTLDRVTSERLTAVLLDRIVAAGIQ